MRMLSRRDEAPRAFDGLVTFFASLHAMRAEKVLKKHGFDCRLIPGPREISPHCGVALQFQYADAPAVAQTLEGNRVQIEKIHAYRLSEIGAALGQQNG